MSSALRESSAPPESLSNKLSRFNSTLHGSITGGSAFPFPGRHANWSSPRPNCMTSAESARTQAAGSADLDDDPVGGAFGLGVVPPEARAAGPAGLDPGVEDSAADGRVDREVG